VYCCTDEKNSKVEIKELGTNFDWFRYESYVTKVSRGLKLKRRLQPHCSITLFLGAFAKLRKATISVVVSVCPSVRIEKIGSHGKDFDEI
jgi:hypothetical protein